MRLPFDIIRCHDHDCPERLTCERYLQREPKDVPDWARIVSAYSLRYGEQCGYKIEAKEHA